MPVQLTRPRPAATTSRTSGFRLTPLCLSLALMGLPLAAHPQAFGSLVDMTAGRILKDGSLSQWSGARRPVVGTAADGRPLMTIEQTQKKALLDWEKFELQAGEILKFQQQQSDWLAVNRVHSATASRIDGEIQALGRVFILNDNGVLMGAGAQVNTRQLVTGKGISDVLLDGATTTLVQSREKATLNWSNMSSEAGEVLRVQQQKKDWVLLNRSLTNGVTTLNGDVKADGHVYLVAPKGLVINGRVEAQQVIASSLNIRDAQFEAGLLANLSDYNGRYDPQFSNTWTFYGQPGSLLDLLTVPEVVDPLNPLKYNVTIGATGYIGTGDFGKVMLFGPNVNNQGTISVRNEGQVILAAGENVYLEADNRNVLAYVGALNRLHMMRINLPYGSGMPSTVTNAQWQDFLFKVQGRHYNIGDPVDFNGLLAKVEAYLNQQQFDRVAAVGYHARNEGVIRTEGGGKIDFRGHNLEQMGIVDVKSTALFRGAITFHTNVSDHREYLNGDQDGPYVPGQGNVVFGRGSMTMITPDENSTETLPLSSGSQSVGSIKVNAGTLHMQEDSLIYMPSGNMTVLLDRTGHMYDNNRGNSANLDNEDGARFMMERGAVIDLSGWTKTELEMGENQVTGKLFAAQLKDSPLQRTAALYRKEISVDRRFGTNLADWQSFDNLSQGTLGRFLIDGGTFSLDVDDDFIMKEGSVINVSGGKVTYKDGYVKTTLLRRLDGSVIDIRNADPDELYMGTANEWVRYDTKWGKQTTYYIPLMSAEVGMWESSYEQGGKGGRIEVIAPDAVLLGSVKGGVTVGRYQRGSMPKAGSFIFNNTGESEGEYLSNNLLVAAKPKTLSAGFGMKDKLSDVYGNLFGEEYDHETDAPGSKGRMMDNATLVSQDFLNSSTMGDYLLRQGGNNDPTNPYAAAPGTHFTVEEGVNINLSGGASINFNAGQRMKFLGSVRTEGGNVSIAASALEFSPSTVIDTRGSWYSDVESKTPAPLAPTPRYNGGNITISSGNVASMHTPEDRMILPEGMKIDSSGGGWVDRNGSLKAGKGGNLSVTATMGATDHVDLSALDSARALGLGGNGAYSFTTGDNIVIGAAPAAPEGGGRGPIILKPTFFENSGFSSISLSAPAISIGDGVQVNASASMLQLGGNVVAGGPAAYASPSGTDIYSMAEAVNLPLAQRPAALRRGMDISLSAGTFTSGTGSLLATDVGGSLSVGAEADIRGTLKAPAGSIVVSGGTGTVERPVTVVRIHETGRLLAPGAVLVTGRKTAADGSELLTGEVLPGGTISVSGGDVAIKNGAVLDVSGTSAVLGMPARMANGAVALVPTEVASSGGSITVSGQRLDVNEATFLGNAGGASARGGAFNLGFAATYGDPSQGPQTPPAAFVEAMESYFQAGYFFDLDYNQVTSLYGTDLSRVRWADALGIDIEFPAGFQVTDRASLVTAFNAYTSAAKGAPPVLIIGDAQIPAPPVPPLPDLPAGLRSAFEAIGMLFPAVNTAPASVARFSPRNVVAGGFSALGISADPGMLFAGDVTIGGRKPDGQPQFDRVSLSGLVMGHPGAKVHIEAGMIQLNGSGGNLDLAGYLAAMRASGVEAINPATVLTLQAGDLLQVAGFQTHGFSDTRLFSGGDIRLAASGGFGSGSGPAGAIQSPGQITLKADQVYAATGRKFEIVSGTGIQVLPQDAGDPLNASPYEAAADLTLRAPRIVQGGILRSPLGTLTLDAVDDGTAGSGTVTLLPGSLTSASAEGLWIPYGRTASGDTWLDPTSGQEMTTLPLKAINLKGKVVDLQGGAVIDVSGGGDLVAREFVPGIGGSYDWLTGYRNDKYQWVSAPDKVFAVIPGFSGDIAPVGLAGAPDLAGVGMKVYLSGGSGLPAGHYTLLPAEYALLPGAFRVTASHNKGDFTGMQLGARRDIADGSSVQAGYSYRAGQEPATPATNGWLVMPGDTVRMRSQFVESNANGFFLSEAFLKKALRTNRPLGEVPRVPLDGGSVVLEAGETLNLDATLKSAAAPGGRGGFADIKASKIAVVGAGTDVGFYRDNGYLVLDSDRLNGFGAESLLLGGVRRQGQGSLEIQVSGTDVVIDNRGSVLAGPELLFASSGRIAVEEGSVVETRGQISGSSGNLRMVPGIAKAVDTRVDWDPGDDVVINAELDQGTVLRLSSSKQVDVLRNSAALRAMEELRNDPARLAQVNAQRALFGLAPIVLGGNLDIADGSVLRSTQSIALEATADTKLGAGATLDTKEISASASRISIGAVPGGTPGLVFAGGSLGALSRAGNVTLRSYGSIDFHGGATLRADGALRLDTSEVRAVNADGATVTISATELALANTIGGTAAASGGAATVSLEGTNIRFEGGDKWINGADTVLVKASERVIGRDDGTVHLPGNLAIDAGSVTAESGARLFFDAGGDAVLTSNGNTALPAFKTLGATLGVTGRNVANQGRIGLTGGTVNLTAREGNVTLAAGSVIDVTSDVSQIFDVAVGVGGGNVNLAAAFGDIDIGTGALIDVSGTAAGGDAGTVSLRAGAGQINLAGSLKGDAQAGSRSGSFAMLSRELGDFASLNAQLDAGGFRQARRFEVNQGDVNIGGTVQVQDFAVVANDGSINLTGTVQTPGANGGRIQLSASRNVNLASGSQLIARATAEGASGGTVFLETVGQGGGVVTVGAGSLIDVQGSGEGGRTVRLRAPQQGGDVAIAPVAGTITGARSILAEGFRVYDGVSLIDQPLIDTVSADATAFMANAQAIRDRIGGGVTVVPGIELRSDGDMELKTNWDLHGLRFGGAAGVLTLRARGDLLINANLSDGFDGSTASAALLGGPSWTLNLTAGANTTSPDSLAVLPTGQLASGKGSVIIGGTPDTIDYYKTADGSEHRLYLRNPDGTFPRNPENNPSEGFIELQRDAATGKYIDPATGSLIEKDPVTGDYADAANYARRPLPTYSQDSGGYQMPDQFGNYSSGYGVHRGVQWDNSTGYMVRTGTGAINVASGRDVVLKYTPSVIYTAGESAPSIAGFYAPTRQPLGDGSFEAFTGYYPEHGGDITLRAQGNVTGSTSDQLPSAWLWRYGSINEVGLFMSDAEMAGASLGRDFNQTTWFVRFDRYRAGVGALGGGNIDVQAGGDVRNLIVNIPTTGRVTGRTTAGEAMAVHTTGGGDLSIQAGGNIDSGVFYVAEGTGSVKAGGSFGTSRKIGWVDGTWRDVYTILLTSTGKFNLQSGGDLNLDAVMDPLNMEQAQDNSWGGGGTYGPNGALQHAGDDRYRALYGNNFFSYGDEASVSLFSAGGDVRVWNNTGNIGRMQYRGNFLEPQQVFGRPGSGSTLGVYTGTTGMVSIWPATLSAVAAAGDVEVRGGMYLAPSAQGNLDLLARGSVRFGRTTRVADPYGTPDYAGMNYSAHVGEIFMSQALPQFLPNVFNPRQSYSSAQGENQLQQAGGGTAFSLLAPPELHKDDARPVRIYAADGDIVTTGAMSFPKQTWLQAGNHIYFPYLSLQHNNPNDMSLVRAGNGLYFAGDSYINVDGPGRLEIETGRDFWIPSNAKGITSNRIAFGNQVWKQEQAAADIAVSTGFNQRPDYKAFEDKYLNPLLAGEMADYLLADAGDGRKLPAYLFDRAYPRGGEGTEPLLMTPELAAGFVNYVRGMQGLAPLETQADQRAYLDAAWDYWTALPKSQATAFDAFMPRLTKAEAAAQKIRPEFYLPEQREGLVNYVRRLQGLPVLATQAEQLAYLDTAWAYWNTLGEDYKAPMVRNAFFMELRTTGREANDPESPRVNTTFRGYGAIGTLFPGAQKREGEALAAGESRWAGDFETFASRIISNGGGKVEFVIPGGAFKLANVQATPGETGQPVNSGDRGNALRAGVVTQDGGEINVFSRGSIILNESRLLTAKGGNILAWSSYGDIAAGKGAKTAISPQFFDYSLSVMAAMNRVPAGLPTGAGIGTLATQKGTPPADVDLIAPNGIIDAGDAGIRSSGNLNLFAVQILGTDNIDVAGKITGLPKPPASPPTSLDVGDVAAKEGMVADALDDSLKKVRENAAIRPPSIIEVNVLGYGEACANSRQSCSAEPKK